MSYLSPTASCLIVLIHHDPTTWYVAAAERPTVPHDDQQLADRMADAVREHLAPQGIGTIRRWNVVRQRTAEHIAVASITIAIGPGRSMKMHASTTDTLAEDVRVAWFASACAMSHIVAATVACHDEDAGPYLEPEDAK